jgi:hypothetical protein
MPRPVGSKNKIVSKITYPRKCIHCDYLSNNPAMYHYHKQIHIPIPMGQMCDHGCGQIAMAINTNGKYTCTNIAHRCPAYTQRLSAQVKTHWNRSDTVNRKEKTKKLFLEHCCNNAAAREKQKQSIKEKWGGFTPQQLKDYRHYSSRIRARAQKWAKSHGFTLGQQTYHVDHKLSIWEAWNLGLPEEIVNHPANLQILCAKENIRKGATSTLSINDLLKLINDHS